MTNSILRALIYDWNDYPEDILEDFEIDFEDWTEEAIESKSDELLDQYHVIDEELLDTDLEKSYQKFQLVFEYEGQIYGVEYITSPYYSPELRTEPYKVKKITHTITIDKYVPCD